MESKPRDLEGLKPLLDLPAMTQEELGNATSTNNEMLDVLEAQRKVLELCTVNHPAVHELKDRLASSEKYLHELNAKVQKSREILGDLLEDKPSDESEVLVSAVNTIQSWILGICYNSAKSGHVDVSITDLLRLESQINELIEKLDANGLYPEGAEEGEKRKNFIRDHLMKVNSFFDAVKANSSDTDSIQSGSIDEASM